jgi:hypothetical protein
VPNYNNRGIVQIYYRNEGGTDNWGNVLSIDGPPSNDRFGESVDLYNDILAVGAPQGGSRGGYINVYDRNFNSGNSWGLISTLHSEGSSELPDMKFGQRVSVFEDVLTTSYFYAYLNFQGNYSSSIVAPIFMKNSENVYGFVDESSQWLMAEPFSNLFGSIALFKDVLSENQPEYKYIALYGSEFVDNNAGACGHSRFIFFEQSNHYSYRFNWIDELDNNIPGELYGKSVSSSYNSEITGIPGYSRDGSHGAIVFQKLTEIKSNFEAGIDFSFCNFTKPSGNYSTVNAANISLGGESLPAVIESGAIIRYEAGEILLKEGFIADRGSNFTALSLQQNDGPGMKPDTFEPEDGIEKPLLAQVNNAQILKAFQRAYPDFPWLLYHPGEDITFTLPDKDKELMFEINYQNNLECSKANGVVPDQNPNQAHYILHLPGHDKKLSLPVKSNISH